MSQTFKKRTYVPNLPSVPRNSSVERKVKIEEKMQVDELPADDSTGCSSTFFVKNRTSVKSFMPVNKSSSYFRPVNKPKYTTPTFSIENKSSDVEHDDICCGLRLKSLIGKRQPITTDLPMNLPVSLPRSHDLPAQLDNSKTSLSLLTDIFTPNGDIPSYFILKIPKHLPYTVSRTEMEEKKKKTPCSLQDLPEGKIGTLQVMKSGRLRLVLADCKFSLNRGVKVNFREELAYVSTNEETLTGEIINLGAVIKDRLIAVPECLTSCEDGSFTCE